MSEGPKKVFGYTRGIALATLVASGLYCGLVVIPDVPSFRWDELWDFSQSVPVAYSAVISFLALIGLLKPPVGTVKQHAIRGVLEGALLAYAWICVTFLRDPAQWGDGTFRWGTLYVGLLLTGPLFSALGAATHLLYAALRPRAFQKS